MKTLVKISWRNIWRNPKRSLVMTTAIALGLWAGILISSLMFGLLDQRFKSSIEQHVSHIQIHNPEFLKEPNLNNHIENWEDIKQVLASDPEVKSFSFRTKATGMLATATQTMGVTINGIDPKMEAATTSLKNNLVDGAYFENGSGNWILVGRNLAEKSKLTVRSRLVLTFQDADGELVSAAFRVAGIFRTSNGMFDEQNVFVHINELTQLVSGATVVNEFAILLNDIDRVEGKKEKLQSKFADLTVRNWAEIAPDLAMMQSISQTMLFVMLAIILLALAFGLVNTMLMSVYERVPELGMLMAIGMNKVRIFGMISLETVFLTLVGAFAGMVLGFTSTKWLGKVGIDFGKIGGESFHDFGFDTVVYPIIDNTYFVTITIMVLFTALITSIFPALKALRLNPAQAVKAE